MKAVHVIVPVLRGTRRFIIEKGRRWSVIEHVLLEAVSSRARSAAELEHHAKLPRRVVIEAFIRLMRAGWVEIVSATDGPQFVATALGLLQAPRDQLQAATTIEPKFRSFAIEQVTGGVFRSRELDIRPYSRLPSDAEDQVVSFLKASELHSEIDLSAVFTAIEAEDELILGVDRSPEKLTQRYAVLTVRDGVIEGLPARATEALRLLVKARAAQVLEPTSGSMASGVTKGTSSVREDEHFEVKASKPALYDRDDLIVDGADHEDALNKLIRNASERVILHSTFITEKRSQAMLPLLFYAASKGTAIDILWGQDDVGTSTSSSRAAASKLQSKIAEAGRTDSISIHPFSTGSHAKIAVADNGKGGWQALVGSCNWLASDFDSFECSIRLRDTALVGELVRKLALLSRGRPGIWHDFAIDLTVLGRRIEAIPRGGGRTVPMRLLFGSDHAQLVLEARDRAKHNIGVLSHRIGISARSVALLPILSAAKAKGIGASIYYGRTTGPLAGSDSAELIREFSKDGVSLRPVHKPRLHAKVLSWDEDALAITSLNWLSADSAEAAVYREVGVLVEAPKLAENFMRRFEHARAD